MATSNFKPQPLFPMYVVDDDYFNIYRYNDEAREDHYEFDEVFYQEIKNKIKDFSDKLEFFDITLQAGYYEGAQIYIEDRHGFNGGEDWDNEDCQYWFYMCRSKAIRTYNSEIRRINKWLKTEMEHIGFRNLEVVARFDNGETIYRYVA